MKSPNVLAQRYEEAVPLSKLKLHPENPRRGSVKDIALSIRAHGFYGAVVVQKSSGRIIAGNHRYQSAESEGLKHIPVIWLDVDDTEAKRILLNDNKANDVSGYDQQSLAALLNSIQSDTGTLEGTGYDQAALDAVVKAAGDAVLAAQEAIAAQEGEDDAPEVADKAISQLGDLWILGDHRVLCGDSTDAKQVARLMDGKKADMVFTDPPYGVGYDGGHFHSGDVNIKRKREKLTGDNSTAIYGLFLPIALGFVEGPCYVWFAHSKAYDVFSAIHASECIVSAVLVWHKTNATYAAMNAQYKQRHEPCAYFKQKGSTLRWVGASTESTLWEEKRDSQNTFHPTQKPVCLAERAIRNHSANTVLDLFGGSGSTLIACDKTERSARLMELDPKYCDVIVKRWQTFTGKEAHLESTGELFNSKASARESIQPVTVKTPEKSANNIKKK